MKERKYDLEERTRNFGKEVIQFAKIIPRNVITLPLTGQLIRSATSVGSNYCEADCAESRKDFEHKLGICKKESKETKHWLIMVAEAGPGLKEQTQELLQDANELHLIFIAIIRNSRTNQKSRETSNRLSEIN